MVRVVQDDAGPNGSGRWIDLIVEKINPANMREAGLIYANATCTGFAELTPFPRWALS